MPRIFQSSLVLLCLLLASTQLKAQFEKTYPTTRDRALRDVIRVGDGYMLCGWTNVANPTECDVLLMKTDFDGNEMSGWPKFLGETGTAKVDFAYSMVETSDGNYFVLGYSSSYGGGDIDICLWKIDAGGNKLWHKVFGSFGFDEGRKIIKTADGNYVIAGTTTSNGEQQACLIKIDKDGNQLWTPGIKMYGAQGSKQFGNSVQQAGDGSYILVGATQKDDARGDSYFVHATAGGDLDWERSYDETFGDEATGLVINSDGSFVSCIRDSTGIGNNENIDVVIRKFDAQGNALSSPPGKRIGGGSKDTPKNMSLAKDGNYYVSVISRSMNWWGQNQSMEYPDMWLLKVKVDAAEIDTVWSRHFGNIDHDHLEQTIPDPVDNAILLCGHQVTQPYVKRAYFLKLNADGLVAPMGISSRGELEGVEMYPNPSSGVVNIQLPNSSGNISMRLVNSVGQTIYYKGNISSQSGSLSTFDLGKNEPGVYFLHLDGEKGSAVQKLIIQ